MTHIIKHLIKLILTITCAAHSCYALTLEEALSSAYKNNHDLQTLRVLFLKEIEQYPQALSAFLPEINADVTINKSTSDPHPSSNGSQKGTTRSTSKGISLNQNLFKGGSSVANLNAAKAGYLYEKSKLESEEQKVMLQAIQSYLNVLLSQENYEADSQSLNAFKKQYESSNERFKVGEATRTEVAQARTALLDAEARKVKSYAELEAAKSQFKVMFGIDGKDLKYPSNFQVAENLNTILSKALSKNPILIAAKHAVEAKKSMVNSQKSLLLPSADLIARASKSDSKTEFKGINNTFKSHRKDLETTLRVNIPIFPHGGAQYSVIRQRTKDLKSSTIGLSQTEESIKSQSTSLFEAYKASKVMINAMTAAVESANLALEGTKQEELVGTKTILDVLSAQKDLDTAKKNAIRIKNDYANYIFNIKSLIGELNAEGLNLKVERFNPQKEFNSIKHKIIGF